MNKLYMSREAQDDLREIKDYIAKELDNPDAAKNVVRKITRSIRRLREYKWIGPALTSIADVREDDYRFLVTGSYITLYRVSGDDVYVDRVLYGRRDYLSLLFGSLPDAEADLPPEN